jgi:serine/threonine protein kinase
VKHSQISFNEIVVEKELGEGSYGKVCLGRWNDALVALKFCKNRGKIDEFITEIKIMVYVFDLLFLCVVFVDLRKEKREIEKRMLFRELPPHPNVVQLFGVSLDGPQPIIVMEYCSGGVFFLLFQTLFIY